MIIEDFAEILSEEILYLLHMEVRKKENVFETSTFLFCLLFVCFFYVHHKQSMDNQTTSEGNRGASKLFYPSHDLNDK